MATPTDPLELRYLAEDYSRLLGLRVVPFGIALLLWFPVWYLPNRSQFGFLIPLLGVLGVVGGFVADDWYKKRYGSATALAPSRRYHILLLAVIGAVFAAFYFLHLVQGSPIGGLGVGFLLGGLPLQGGGWRRVRWHYLLAGAALVAITPANFLIASSLGGGIIATLGLVDHLLFVRRFGSPSGAAV